MTTAESAEATTRKPKKMLEEILNAIGDSLNDHASSDNVQDGQHVGDNDEDTKLSKLRDDDVPGWVTCTISKTVQHRMECLGQKQKRVDELTQT
jgi:hypothetical protein